MANGHTIDGNLIDSDDPLAVTVVSGGDSSGLTDTELRATPVPVSGTVTATPTGTQNTVPLAKRVADPTGGALLEVKYAKAVVSADTADFIAGVASKKILVLEAMVQKQADNTNLVIMKFNNSVANTLIAGAPEVTMKSCGDGAVLPFSSGGWFVTSADAEGIDLDITAAENVMVMVGYAEID